MTKGKLFTPEDFDKPKDKRFWQKYNGLIFRIAVLVLLIVAAIVLYYIFCNKEEQTEEAIEKDQTEQVSENPEPPVTNTVTEGIETEMTEETQEITNVKPTSTLVPAPVGETLPPDYQQEVATPAPAAQLVKVSDNVEQEAMNVIRGDYGNVPERRNKLGNKYQDIQNRVNQLKKEGVF